ncbi:hypothetical protein M3Y99_00652800 [Aphelenchoides fujianensis]|nr:hypothetical protein M3Y99_00652800 [Aphelenchoides fujianensis]
MSPIVLLGSEKQGLVLNLDTSLAASTIIDEHCGREQRVNCPAYCDNFDFTALYCPFACRVFTSVKCVRPSNPFVSANSTTFRELDGEWRVEQHQRLLYGTFASDQALMIDWEATAMLPLKEFQFVRLLVEQEPNGGYGMIPMTGAFGLAPLDHYGSVNFVHQVANQGVIEDPIISLRLGEEVADGRILLGGLDEACTEWTGFPNRNLHSWILEADDIKLSNGITHRGTNRILIAPHKINTFLPAEVIDQLVQNYVLYPVRSPYPQCTYMIWTKQTAALIVQLEGSVYSLPLLPNGSSHQWTLECTAFDRKPQAAKYTDDVDWIFGRWFFQSVCTAYDYRSNEIKLGLKK